MGWDRYFYTDVDAGYEGGFSGMPQYLERDKIATVHKSVYVPIDGDYYLQLKPTDGATATLKSPTPRYAAAVHGDREEVIVSLKAGKTPIEVELTAVNKSVEARLECRLFHLTRGRVQPDGSLKNVTRVGCNGEIYKNQLPIDKLPHGDGGSIPTDGYLPGAGVGFKGYGRFGFSKGDGVLDYSMPAFGIISRPFITGNPRYLNETMWHFSILPDGECESGSTNKVYDLPENETVECDWTHTRWQRNLKDGRFISYDYSTVAPSLLIETNLCELRLSRLESIGAYSRVTLPTASGLVTRPCEDGLLYCKERDGELSRGYVMLSYSGAFPEVPLLVSLPRSPERITRTEDEIRFIFDGEIGEMSLGFPFGIELFDTADLTADWYGRVGDKIDLYHRLSLMRPINAREYYKPSIDRIEVITKYGYRKIADSFGTAGIKCAPIPPFVLLASMGTDEVRYDSRAASMSLPTKYGPLYGVMDSDFSQYSMPVPDSSAGIPFSAVEYADLGELLHKDFDEFLEYHSDPTTKLNPGAFSFIFHYSFVAKLFPYLKKEDKDRLTVAMKEGLSYVTNPDYRYTGPEQRPCTTWYTRTEPFSGASFLSTYLHVTGISKYRSCDRETIENSKNTFIEVDWGNAMAIYGAYLGAMISGDWERVRGGYEVLRRAFDYYLVSMDWPCLTAAYAENGQSWCDGTNYGAFVGFLGITRALGMRDDENIATYAYSKLVTMRLGGFVATQKYFAHYLGVEPWRCLKFINEETDGCAAFNSYLAPSVNEGYRSESFYNLTTEGHYREALNMYSTLLSEEMTHLIDAAEKCCQNMTGPASVIYHSPNPRLLGEQETYSYLMSCMLTGRYPRDKMLGMIREARENKRISLGMLGSNYSQRKVPVELTYASLLAELASADAPRIAGWYGVVIESAEYPEITVTTERGGYIELSSKRAISAMMNGASLKIDVVRPDVYRIVLHEGGRITLG